MTLLTAFLTGMLKKGKFSKVGLARGANLSRIRASSEEISGGGSPVAQ